MHNYNFNFPNPATGGSLSLKVVFPDSNGFVQCSHFTQDDISQEQAETFNEVVTHIAVLSNEWKALQVWRGWNESSSIPFRRKGSIPGIQRCGCLTVEAVHVQGGRRLFTSQDYSEFTMMDEAAMAFFSYFTINSNK